MGVFLYHHFAQFLGPFLATMPTVCTLWLLVAVHAFLSGGFDLSPLAILLLCGAPFVFCILSLNFHLIVSPSGVVALLAPFRESSE